VLLQLAVVVAEQVMLTMAVEAVVVACNIEMT
jgi:hypothetical protein